MSSPGRMPTGTARSERSKAGTRKNFPGERPNDTWKKRGSCRGWKKSASMSDLFFPSPVSPKRRWNFWKAMKSHGAKMPDGWEISRTSGEFSFHANRVPAVDHRNGKPILPTAKRTSLSASYFDSERLKSALRLFGTLPRAAESRLFASPRDPLISHVATYGGGDGGPPKKTGSSGLSVLGT